MQPTSKKPAPKKLKLSMKKTMVTELGADQLEKVVGGLVSDNTCTFGGGCKQTV